MAIEEFKVKISGEERVLLLKPMTGGHAKKGLKFLTAIGTEDDSGQALSEYMNFLDDLTCELSGLTMEEL